MNDNQIGQDAVAAYNRNDRIEALKLIKQLIENNAQIGNNWGTIANIAAIYGEVSLARASIDKIVEMAPTDIPTQLAAAGMLADLGQINEALDRIKPLLANDASDPAVNHFFGTIQAQKGNGEVAIKHLRKTLKGWETSGQTWLLLASLKTFTAEDKDLKHMESLRTMAANTPEENFAAFLYALAKAHCDAGDLDKAFTYYGKAANIAAEKKPFNGMMEQHYVDDLIENIKNDEFGKFKPGSSKSERAIFVMGTPRSGSTLVEQILTSHSKVADGSELNLFRLAAMDMGGFDMAHIQEYYKKMGSSGKAWDHLADTYFHLVDERFGKSTKAQDRIVDKTLNNSRFLGLIHLALPKAPIIWMRRNPADAALSCFRTFFNKGLSWTWSFTEIALYFRLEDALYKHWTKLYPKAILTVPYEDLVREPKVWIPKILKHCNLQEEDGVYNSHKSKRAVLTSSVDQVRKPINTKAIGSAKKYAKYMEAFHAIYNQPVKD